MVGTYICIGILFLVSLCGCVAPFFKYHPACKSEEEVTNEEGRTED